MDVEVTTDVRRRHAVHETGPLDGRPLVFAHGFGCSQAMWRHVAPRFADDHRVVLFDHLGAGGADVRAYDPDRHATLDGYAEDVVALVEDLDLWDATFVGHSVSAMIGVLAHARVPERITELVLVCPSPRYLDDDGYVGGFAAEDVEELLDLIDRNHVAWSAAMAPTIMGTPDRPELTAELEDSFCRVDADIARHFARATFLADNRRDLDLVDARTLVLQSADDVIAPPAVGAYVADRIADSELVVLPTQGHCPNLSAPDVTTEAIARFLATRPAAMTDGAGSRRPVTPLRHGDAQATTVAPPTSP